MNINTKYDLGQEVWRPQWLGTPDDGKYGPVSGCVVYITVTRNGNYYGLTMAPDDIFEDDIFPTKTEAQAECDRRNGATP